MVEWTSNWPAGPTWKLLTSPRKSLLQKAKSLRLGLLEAVPSGGRLGITPLPHVDAMAPKSNMCCSRRLCLRGRLTAVSAFRYPAQKDWQLGPMCEFSQDGFTKFGSCYPLGHMLIADTTVEGNDNGWCVWAESHKGHGSSACLLNGLKPSSMGLQMIVGN